MSRLALGTLVRAGGPVARLRDIVNRTPRQWEQMFGFYAGQLNHGYQLLLLKDAVAGHDLDVDEHLRLQDAELRARLFGRRRFVTRSRLGGAYVVDFTVYASAKLGRDIAAEIHLQGPNRLVKIIPLAGPAPSEFLARTSSKRGPQILHLAKQKMFLVAAEMDAKNHFCGQGLSLELDAFTRFDQRSSIVRYLAAA